MAEYIKREDVIWITAETGALETQGRVRDLPAADVRCVVTCGECEFWNRERISCEGLARRNTGESGIRYRNRDDFCSRGKKREES